MSRGTRDVRRPRFPGAEDLTDMFEFYRLYMPRRTKEIARCQAVAPDLQSFQT